MLSYSEHTINLCLLDSESFLTYLQWVGPAGEGGQFKLWVGLCVSMCPMARDRCILYLIAQAGARDGFRKE